MILVLVVPSVAIEAVVLTIVRVVGATCLLDPAIEKPD
jgi:hypothetical protein